VPVVGSVRRSVRDAPNGGVKKVRKNLISRPQGGPTLQRVPKGTEDPQRERRAATPADPKAGLHLGSPQKKLAARRVGKRQVQRNPEECGEGPCLPVVLAAQLGTTKAKSAASVPKLVNKMKSVNV